MAEIIADASTARGERLPFQPARKKPADAVVRPQCDSTAIAPASQPHPMALHDFSAPRFSSANTEQRPLVVLGASVRAMSSSATQAGWNVYAADLFCDLDLLATAVAARRIGEDVGGYPAGLAECAAAFPDAPWCYTGAIENYPHLIDQIAALRPLAGNTGDIVRRVRDPATLARVLRQAGLHVPETSFTPVGIRTDGSFVQKPIASAGGRGVARWTASLAHHWQAARSGFPTAPPTTLWQKWIDGDSMAAAFILSPRSAQMIGLSHQLVGQPWCYAAPHAYCGSIHVPLASIQATTHHQLTRLGLVLSQEFGLLGAVGVDLVVDPEGNVTVIEVNPRPTASMEIIERANGVSIAKEHLFACGFSATPLGASNKPSPAPARTEELGRYWSKAVLFARHDIPIQAALHDQLLCQCRAWSKANGSGWAAIADLPTLGQTIPSTRPAVTIFACGNTASASYAQLTDRTAAITAILATGNLTPPAKE